MVSAEGTQTTTREPSATMRVQDLGLAGQQHEAETQGLVGSRCPGTPGAGRAS